MAQEMQTRIRPLWHDPSLTPGRISVSPTRRTRRVMLVAALLIVSLSSAAGLLSWLMGQPKVHFVSCWVTRFRDPTINPNPAADQDRVSIECGEYFAKTDIASMPIHSRYLMQQQLAAVAEGSRSEQIVLYVGTYASVDDQGNVVLLSSDFDAGRPETGLPLAVVLQSLAKSSARHKLLILDVFAPCFKPSLDAAGVNVTKALAQQLKAIPDANRLVLCSCSPGQSTLDSETLQRTVFGYYFEQALRGAADGYNPTGTRDGRVSVCEAAGMLRARVDRWARHNRARRQITHLFGTGDDFELTVCRKRPIEPAMKDDKKLALKYPSWLIDGWKLREHWEQQRLDRLAPRIVRSLETSLLRIECKWRFGASEKGLERECAERIDDLRRLADLAAQQIAGPDPTSLAALVASGHSIDERATPAVGQVLQAMKSVAAGRPADRQAVLQKQWAEFDKQTQQVSDADIALAVVHAATGATSPNAESLYTLAELLRHRKISDQWIETRTVYRLATQAADVPGQLWSTFRATQLLRIVQRREEVLCHSETRPWMRPLVDAAAQACHDADVYFWKQRYVPMTLVDQSLANADALCDSAVAHETLLVGATLACDEAMQTLPRSAAYVRRYPAGANDWEAAVEAAVLLAETLESATAAATVTVTQGEHVRHAAATEDTENKPVLSSQQLAAIQKARDSVVDTLCMVERPFSSSAVRTLAGRCQATDATPELFAEVDALLATPLILAEDRAALWTARATLARRLHERVMRLDRQEQDGGYRTAVLAGYDSDAALGTEASLANLRHRVSCALLKLGGVSVPESLEGPQDQSRLTCVQLVSMSRIWSRTLRELIEHARSNEEQERFCAIFPPLQPLPLLDQPATNPSIQAVASQRRQLWSWLAHWYRYETLDSSDPEFYARLAVQYAPYLRGESLPSLQAESPASLQPAILGSESVSPGQSECDICWTATTSRGTLPAVGIDIFNPANPWLSVTSLQQTTDKQPASPLRLALSLDPGAKFSGSPPLGFLIRWRVRGRSFHRSVDVPALADLCNLSVLLSSSKDTPDPAIERVLLRPHTPSEPLYLFVQNRGLKARTLTVQLSTGIETAKPVEVAAGASVRVQFPPPTPKPATPPPATGSQASGDADQDRLPELDQPLQVILADAANGREVCRKSFPIQLLAPRQYVDVRHVRFYPAGDDKNQLEIELQQRGAIPGPPCSVSLNVCAADIPGMLGLGDGLLSGALPPDGTPVTLFARNLQLSDSTSDQGRFSVTVDGVAETFIFDTTFARRGDPTTPVEAIRPTVQLTAPQHGLSASPFVVQIECNYAPENACLEILVGRQISSGEYSWERRRQLPGACHRRIGFSAAGKDGALLFDACVGNWQVPLDMNGLVGHRVLHVRLLDDNDRELAIARQQIVVGNLPPQGVQFVEAPHEAWNGQPLELTAMSLQSVPEVSRVVFFLGKPDHNTIPKGAVTVEAATQGEGTRLWTAQLPVQTSDKGKTDVSAQFTNAAGLSSFATTTVELTDTAIGHGTISGHVVEGRIRQSGLEVVLKDDQAAVKGKVLTTTDGTFLFENLKPGHYEISTSKPTSGRRGTANVTVQDHTTTQVKVQLWL